MATETGAPDLGAEALATRLFTSALGTLDLLHVYVGQKLGLYRLMAREDSVTPTQLAAGAGMHVRYAREWLEQQAVTGILLTDGTGDSPDQRSYRLPPGHAEALTSEESMNYLAPMAGMLVSVAQQMPELLDAYRSGRGVDWATYGPDMWQGQAAVNRPLFVNKLGQEYLPSIPEVDAILSGSSAHVADLACGGGWSSIAIARAYPGVTVDGYDLDSSSIEQAARAAAAAGLSDRVRFHVADAAAMSAAEGTFDLVTIFEAVHDVSNPVGMLTAALRMLRAGGRLLVMDERVADELTAPGDDVERFMYGWSMTVCLPSGMSDQPSAATGTVMRRSTLEGYAREAGFSAVDVCPIDNDFFRFYLIRP
ncbi:MAG TPA: class I SAM-dependent methyltransferase [Candidatus Dormibacteraeota bacterium]